MLSEQIPLKQKAAIYDLPNEPIEVRDVEVPEPKHDEVLVKLLYSGVCHSDLHGYKGEIPAKMPLKYPIIGGHEGAGIVVKIGSAVTHLKCGDRVGVKWMHKCCMNCEFCRKGFESSCMNPLYTGFYVDGTFCQYTVANALEVIPIPESVSMAEAAPLFCGGMTVYRALLEANLQAGQTVVVVGCAGGLGSFAVQFAKAMGYRVLGIDLKSKAAACQSIGLDHFIEGDSPTQAHEKVMELTGIGAHAILNVATSKAATEASLDYVRPRGTVVLIGLPSGAIQLDLFSSVIRCITIKASLVGNRQDAIEAMEFMARGQIKVPIEMYTLKDLPGIFERMEHGQINGRAVIDLWK